MLLLGWEARREGSTGLPACSFELHLQWMQPLCPLSDLVLPPVLYPNKLLFTGNALTLSFRTR